MFNDPLPGKKLASFIPLPVLIVSFAFDGKIPEHLVDFKTLSQPKQGPQNSPIHKYWPKSNGFRLSDQRIYKTNQSGEYAKTLNNCYAEITGNDHTRNADLSH